MVNLKSHLLIVNEGPEILKKILMQIIKAENDIAVGREAASKRDERTEKVENLKINSNGGNNVMQTRRKTR